MDWDDSPGTLNAELFEKCGSHDAAVAHEGVWIQKSTPENTDDDDAEAAAEYLAEVTDGGAAGQGSEIGNHLGDGDSVVGKVILIF